jgi:hypothetical protein
MYTQTVSNIMTSSSQYINFIQYVSCVLQIKRKKLIYYDFLLTEVYSLSR